MLLRPGNGGSNTVADHIRVLAEAFEQVPVRYRGKILVRIDGAGATHELLEHLQQMCTGWRTVRFTVGWMITEVDEAAIAALSADAWTSSLDQDGDASTAAGVADLTGLDARVQAWTPGLRLIARRTRPSRRHKAKLTALERVTGWRYAIVATNISRIWGVPAHTIHSGSMRYTVGTPRGWRVRNGDAAPLDHTFHMHLVQFRLVGRSRGSLLPEDAGRKDTVIVPAGEWVDVQPTFGDHLGKYVFHCDFVEHSGMMGQLDIVS